MDSTVNRTQWRKRSQRNKPYLLSISLIFFFLLFTIFILTSYFETLSSFFTPSPFASKTLTVRSTTAPCVSHKTPTLDGERFLWYAPHSGFSNQLSELKNAILIGAILNRTVVVPPVLDHHAVALGSCPKFRVKAPSELRAAVWDHIMELVKERR